MKTLEDRLPRHAAKIAFLCDFTSQPAPYNAPGLELSEEGRFGLSNMLRELKQEALQLQDDAANIELQLHQLEQGGL